MEEVPLKCGALVARRYCWVTPVQLENLIGEASITGSLFAGSD